MRLILTAMIFAWAELVVAQPWYEPPRGSPERRALMEAFRPEAEALFGEPVEFVISSLRVSGDIAFASVGAQRPGGAAIDIRRTPGWAQGYIGGPEDDAHYTGGQALLRRQGGRWVVADFAFGATDVWWAYGPICAEFRPVIADACP